MTRQQKLRRRIIHPQQIHQLIHRTIFSPHIKIPQRLIHQRLIWLKQLVSRSPECNVTHWASLQNAKRRSSVQLFVRLSKQIIIHFSDRSLTSDRSQLQTLPPRPFTLSLATRSLKPRSFILKPRPLTQKVRSFNQKVRSFIFKLRPLTQKVRSFTHKPRSFTQKVRPLNQKVATRMTFPTEKTSKLSKNH